jgi:hypothetical protein
MRARSAAATRERSAGGPRTRLEGYPGNVAALVKERVSDENRCKVVSTIRNTRRCSRACARRSPDAGYFLAEDLFVVAERGSVVRRFAWIVSCRAHMATKRVIRSARVSGFFADCTR